jgi:ATP-dependent Lon protease
MEIIPVSRMDEVIARALVRKPEAIVWEEPVSKPAATASDEDAAAQTAH